MNTGPFRLRALSVDQEQSRKEISYQNADINTIRAVLSMFRAASEGYETPNCSMCLQFTVLMGGNPWPLQILVSPSERRT